VDLHHTYPSTKLEELDRLRIPADVNLPVLEEVYTNFCWETVFEEMVGNAENRNCEMNNTKVMDMVEYTLAQEVATKNKEDPKLCKGEDNTRLQADYTHHPLIEAVALLVEAGLLDPL